MEKLITKTPNILVDFKTEKDVKAWIRRDINDL